jgi:aminoglycoside 3-N-acetyltransferase I
MVPIHRLQPGDTALFTGMLDLFGTAFDDPEAYGAKRPSADYVTRLLASPFFVGLVAIERGQVLGALAAYELLKFEQERSEFYIYDLAVAARHRRRGIATALISATSDIARARGGWVVMIQADHGDDPAIALYTKLGRREDVVHFDIPIA